MVGAAFYKSISAQVSSLFGNLTISQYEKKINADIKNKKDEIENNFFVNIGC